VGLAQCGAAGQFGALSKRVSIHTELAGALPSMSVFAFCARAGAPSERHIAAANRSIENFPMLSLSFMSCLSPVRPRMSDLEFAIILPNPAGEANNHICECSGL